MISSQIDMIRLFKLAKIYDIEEDEMEMYVWILNNPGKSASQLATIGEKDRTKCYRLSEKLQNKGMVHKTLQNPARFNAVPIKEIIDFNIEKKKNELKEMNEEKNGEEILKLLQNVDVHTTDDVSSMNISGHDNYIAFATKIIRESKQCMLLISNLTVQRGYYTNMPETLNELDDSWICGNFPMNVLKKFKCNHSHRIINPLDFDMIVGDSSLIIETSKNNYFWTNSPILINSLKSFLENLYNASPML